ncbi:hypothetical protein GCWU000342_01784 [Shuttleworthella satelles DSM 14600]|uniref:Uncharacterized protein n=1 Tax=Shuttleworthella satelles DSM 14600 TaxID=626523 RepID=C4GCU0_9FIRM|nr:hypothetical protein GCWU000342_01784 [Shuttleworthia satelles DSM 14600]
MPGDVRKSRNQYHFSRMNSFAPLNFYHIMYLKENKKIFWEIA